MSTAVSLTPTSYAVLGLLAIKDWSTYELAQQMDRTMNRFWPRARSKLYEEPKKLVAHGLARSSSQTVGRRPRTVYGITAKGRRSLAAWVAAPGEGPVLEFEQLLKVFLADSGTTTDLRRTLHDTRAWAHERTLFNIEVVQAHVDGTSEFPQRAAVNHLVGRFLDDLLTTVDDWAIWADGVVQGWPELPADAEPDLAALTADLRKSRARAARWLRSDSPEAGRSPG